MTLTEEEFLFQTDLQHLFTVNLESENWTLVYHSFRDVRQNGAFFSALAPNEKVPSILQKESWDVSIGGGSPSVWVSNKDGEEVSEYHNYTEAGQIQPIVLVRSFHKIRPSYFEIQEEFRLFHNLYYDKAKNKYIKIDEDGNEEDIVLVEDKTVRIRTRALREYAAIKDMSIAFFVDSVRYSPIVLENIPESRRHLECHDDNKTYFVHLRENFFLKSPDRQTLSRFLGKRIIKSLPKERVRNWTYENEPKNYESFIVGLDEFGDRIAHSSDPDKLANYFGTNPEAPHYLTPVFFRKEVLNKYYAQPQKYEVRDGHLFCGSLWCLRMDNDNKDYVVVYLGDLGRDLSHSEQSYWKTFNIPPEGGVSKTCYIRSIAGERAYPETPDLRFKLELSNFKKEWERKHGWPLFLELSSKDQHLLTALHLPTTDDQSEFDSQVLYLTKILVDSLNETELNKQISACPADAKGITKLGIFLRESDNPAGESVVSFLRNLQKLRSTGSGHRKGKDYEKVARRFGIGNKDLQQVFSDILTDAISTLAALCNEVEIDNKLVRS